MPASLRPWISTSRLNGPQLAGWVTSVAAGRRWGLPLSGTMAHSFVMSFDHERDAFRAYARTFPDARIAESETRFWTAFGAV